MIVPLMSNSEQPVRRSHHATGMAMTATIAAAWVAASSSPSLAEARIGTSIISTCPFHFVFLAPVY
jgi:hypothetical protein